MASFILARHQPPAPTSAPHPSSGSSFPDLLAVPTNLPNFEDLAGRFENLKKKVDFAKIFVHEYCEM